MTRSEDKAFREWLERPALRRIWAAARDKVESYGGVRGRLRLDNPTAEERRAVADILGLRTVPPRGRPLTLDLCRLDRRLLASRFAIGLKETLQALSGPLVDRPAQRKVREQAWREFWDTTRRDPRLLTLPEAEAWLTEIEATGLYRRLAGRRDEPRAALLDRSLAVLAALPATAEPDIRLPVLASRALGDSHALDPQHRVAALVLRALAHRNRRPMPSTAVERRALWAENGVICDDLSCQVLVLGLRPPGETLLHRFLRQHSSAGEPVWITLRQLVGGPPLSLDPNIGTDQPVHVCENPAVLALAADRLAGRCPPMVCLSGQPDTAAHVLLRQLVDIGATLRYHGDFDWGGLRIANTLHRALPFIPWRYTTSHYLRAARSPDLPGLGGNPVDAAWDSELRSAMETTGKVVEEEAVIEDLLGDLEKAAR